MTITAARRAFGNTLKSCREKHGLSLRDIGQRTGVPYACVSMLESGQRGIGPSHAAKIAAALKLEGRKRDNFLTLASKTLTEAGRKRVATGCPAHLAQVFAQQLMFLGIDFSRIDTVGSVSMPALFSATTERTLHYACESGAMIAPLKSTTLKHVASHKTARFLFVVFLRDGRQAVVECGTQFF